VVAAVFGSGGVRQRQQKLEIYFFFNFVNKLKFLKIREFFQNPQHFFFLCFKM